MKACWLLYDADGTLDGSRDRLRSPGARGHHAGHVRAPRLRIRPTTGVGDLRRLRDDRSRRALRPRHRLRHPPPPPRRVAPRPAAARLPRQAPVRTRLPPRSGAGRPAAAPVAPPHPAALPRRRGRRTEPAPRRRARSRHPGRQARSASRRARSRRRRPSALLRSRISRPPSTTSSATRRRLTCGGPRFTPALAVRLNDTLGSTRFNVRKPTRLCAPADKDGNGIVDPIANLERYTLQRMRGTPRLRPQHAAGRHRARHALSRYHPTRPAPRTDGRERAVAQPTALDAASHHVDHYKCYQVHVTRKTPEAAARAAGDGDRPAVERSPAPQR